MAGMILLIATTLFSCKKASYEPEQATTDAGSGPIGGKVDPPGGCAPTEVALIAGQNINAGTVTVTNDANFIYVTYATTNGWTISQTHLYVGDCALIPVNHAGNPQPGHFPYTGTHSNVTSYTYQVPISAIPEGDCGCIAAHCVVNKSGPGGGTQTAWGNGSQINVGGSWAMKFDFCSCVAGS